MNDPSQGVPPALLPHVHLLSTYRYPNHAHLSIENTVEYLLQAPRITREAAPMTWTFLDGPPDGSVMLVWQSPNLKGRCATDGYLWADQEQMFNSELRGYKVEMLILRGGFHPPHENVTAHCRRRFRLTGTSNPNLPPPDINLWMMHYSRTEPQHQQNITSITPPMQASIQQRQYLARFGQIIRKEFMLMDRNNWPQITLPTGQGTPYAQPRPNHPVGAMANIPRGQQAYLDPQADGLGPSPSKRQRQAAAPRSGQNTMAAMAMHHDIPEDDDGDLIDMLTPREVSTMRYVQHHQWMEEVFNSPYTTNQIEPVDMGLGRKGALESLTRGYFFAPTDIKTQAKDIYVGKMDAGKAAEFRTHSHDKITEIVAEIDKMKLQHSKRMATIRKGSEIRKGEKQLRDMALLSADPGADKMTILPDQIRSNLTLQHQEKLDQVIREVEAALGRCIETSQSYKCIQQGGLEQRPSTPTFLENDTLMVIPLASGEESLSQAKPDLDAHAQTFPPANAATAVEKQAENDESTDWVMVEKQAESATHSTVPHDTNAKSGGLDHLNLPEDSFGTTNFDDGIDFGDVDVNVDHDGGGDALLDFDASGTGIDPGQVELGLDGSAFGDAFHPSEPLQDLLQPGEDEVI